MKNESEPFWIVGEEELSSPSTKKLEVFVGLNICEGDCCVIAGVEVGVLKSNPPKRSKRSFVFVTGVLGGTVVVAVAGTLAIDEFKSAVPRRSKRAFC